MQELHSAYQRTAVIGGAMLMSLIAYVIVAFVLGMASGGFRGAIPELDGGTVELLRYGFAFVCLVEVVLVRWFKGRAFASPEVAAEPPPLPELIGKLVSTHILVFALAESIGILGLVFFLLTGSSADLYAFVGLSALLLVLSFPRRAQWQEWLNRQGMGARL